LLALAVSLVLLNVAAAVVVIIEGGRNGHPPWIKNKTRKGNLKTRELFLSSAAAVVVVARGGCGCYHHRMWLQLLSLLKV